MSDTGTDRLPAGIRDAKSPSSSPRLEASHSFTVRGRVDDVFHLFDPVSERDWVDDWDPEPVYPEELSREAGSVFTLERDGRTAIWTTLRHDPVQHLAEYLVADPGYQHRWICVSCSDAGGGTTRVGVRYVTTALSPLGQQDIERYGVEFLKAWEAPVQAALDRSSA